MQDAFAALIMAELASSPLRGGRHGFWLSSRLHPLPAWPNFVWLKRDDELSCSISGSKYRKLVSLSAAWQRQEADCLIAWGSSRSQHLLGLMQLSREHGLDIFLFLKESSEYRAYGPDQLWSLFNGRVKTEILSRQQWPLASQLATALKCRLVNEGRRPFFIEEGAAQAESMLGAMSMAWDIYQQELNLAWHFTHIWVDAGTGLTAQALLLGLALFGRRPLCEVVLCAGNSEQFGQTLAQRQKEFALKHQVLFPELPQFRCHQPASARSFGSTNAAVFKEIKQTAAESGVLLDPIYSAKLFLTARQIVPSYAADARVLLIHSGGVLSLFGFDLNN